MANMHPTQTTQNFSNPTLPTTNKGALKVEMPTGWDIARVQRILAGYEPQQQKPSKTYKITTLKKTEQKLIEVPEALIPAVLEMIEKHKAA